MGELAGVMSTVFKRIPIVEVLPSSRWGCCRLRRIKNNQDGDQVGKKPGFLGAQKSCLCFWCMGILEHLHLLDCFWWWLDSRSMAILQGCWRGKSEADCTSLQWSESDRNKDNKWIHWNFSWVIATFVFPWRCLRMFFHVCSTYPPPSFKKSIMAIERGSLTNNNPDSQHHGVKILISNFSREGSFTQEPGEIDDPNLTSIFFSNGLVQPPTRKMWIHSSSTESEKPQTMREALKTYRPGPSVSTVPSITKTSASWTSPTRAGGKCKEGFRGKSSACRLFDTTYGSVHNIWAMKNTLTWLFSHFCFGIIPPVSRDDIMWYHQRFWINSAEKVWKIWSYM